METISLKLLALKVIQGNSQGNHMETIPEVDGNFAGKKENARKPTEGEVLSFGLSEFKPANLAVRIRSKVLGEDVWLVSNEMVRDHLEAEGLVAYLPDEIFHLKGLSQEAIRQINEVKRVFIKSHLINK